VSSPQIFPAELLSQPATDRVRYFRQLAIRHPRLGEVYERVIQAIREPASAGLVVVYGPTGVGKTTLRLRVQRQLMDTLRVELEQDPGRLAVVGLEAVAGESVDFNWRDFYKRLLRTIDEPMTERKVAPGARLSDRAAAPELRYAVEQALRHRRPAAVLIDEAQHLNRIASGRRLFYQLDTLKSLASLTGVVHVLLGTYDLLAMTNLSGQLTRRTIDVHFPRYHADRPDDVSAFQTVVRSFQQHLPVQEVPKLVERWEELYQGSVGCVGVLKDWLTRGLALALEQGGNKLTHAHLDAQALSRTKLLQMARENKEGEERLAEPARTVTELRTLLGMRVEVVPPPDAVPSGGPTGRLPRPRVGERRPTRDAVGGL
jgi:hypothetical protein